MRESKGIYKDLGVLWNWNHQHHQQHQLRQLQKQSLPKIISSQSCNSPRLSSLPFSASGKLSSRVITTSHSANTLRSATAFALPADAAVASAATPNVAADPPFCDRYPRDHRDYPRECDRRGNCGHNDWRERGRDCPRPRFVNPKLLRFVCRHTD